MKRKLMIIAAALGIFAAGTTAGATGLGFAESISAEISQQLEAHAAEVKKQIVLGDSFAGSHLMTILLEFKEGEIERGKAALDAAGERRIQRLKEESGATDEEIAAEKEAIRKLTDAKIAELVKQIEEYEF